MRNTDATLQGIVNLQVSHHIKTSIQCFVNLRAVLLRGEQLTHLAGLQQLQAHCHGDEWLHSLKQLNPFQTWKQ